MDGCQWHDVQAKLKRCVLRAVLKVPKVPESRMGAGILFQIAGAESAMECWWKSEEACG